MMLEYLLEADSFVRDRLSEKRYAHTWGVAYTAEQLAGTHGLNSSKAQLAAVLHDAARELKKEEFLRLAGEWSLPVGEPELENPKLLHGPVAAEMSRRELGVEDWEVLEAIRLHTTAEPGMGSLSILVYVADKIEPGRDYPSVGYIRKLAEEDLAVAARESLLRSIEHNDLRGRPTHPASFAALEWLEKSVDAGVDRGDHHPRQH